MNETRGYLLLFYLFFNIRFSYGLHESKFYTGVLCDLKDRIKFNCSVFKAEIKTFNECVVKCGRDPMCVGASSDVSHGTCVHHHTCDELSGCSEKEHSHKYVSKDCAHIGVWSPDTLTCSCRNGWIGKNCLDLPEKCRDLKTYGYSSRRTYLAIQLSTSPIKYPTPAPVYCRVSSSSSWTCLDMMRNTGNIDFNRTWEDYKNGFYVDIRNFWIGLDSWHFLTKAGYTGLTVAMTVGKKFRSYSGFKVGDESQHYAFTFISTIEGTRTKSDFQYANEFKDCLKPLKNKPFVTFDRNSDCARKVGSGWWHDADQCTSPSYCNLLGKTPKNWNADLPMYQRLRVEGFDPDVMAGRESDISSYIYLRYEA